MAKKSKGMQKLLNLEIEQRNKKYPALAASGKMVAPKGYKEGDTNSFTKAVASYIQLATPYSHSVRINTQGQYDAKMGTYRKSGSTKGVSDIRATVHGISLCIEVKKGKDKLRAAQEEQRTQELKAGGLFWVVYVGDITAFTERFDKLITSIPPKFIDFMKELQSI